MYCDCGAKLLFQVLNFMFPFHARLVEGGFLILWLNQMKEKAVRERNRASNEQVIYSLCVCLWVGRRILNPVAFPTFTATAIPFIYYFSGNSAASAPISTFMCL
jgi:hypothetical protein